MKIISAVLIIVYVGLLIFLRKPLRRFDNSEVDDIPDNNINTNIPVTQTPSPYGDDPDGSFKVVRTTKNDSVITNESYLVSGKYNSKPEIPADLKERYDEIANESLPKEIGEDGQFSFVLERILTIIKESFHAHSAILFWYLKKKNKLSVEKFASNSKDLEYRKYDIEDDILSHIVERGEPEILTNILLAAEADVIRYYKMPQGIKSVVGVPVFYNNLLIGVVLIDSKETDIYGIETIYSLGRFVRLVTILIGLFEERYSETVSQKRLTGLLNFISPLLQFVQSSAPIVTP